MKFKEYWRGTSVNNIIRLYAVDDDGEIYKYIDGKWEAGYSGVSYKFGTDDDFDFITEQEAQDTVKLLN